MSINNSIQIQPVVIDFFKKIKATQLTWKIISIERNNPSSATCLVELYDIDDVNVGQTHVEIPSSILQEWSEDVVIDKYIIETLGILETVTSLENEK